MFIQSHIQPSLQTCQMRYANTNKGNKMWRDVLGNIYKQNEATHKYGEENTFDALTNRSFSMLLSNSNED